MVLTFLKFCFEFSAARTKSYEMFFVGRGGGDVGGIFLSSIEGCITKILIFFGYSISNHLATTVHDAIP